MIAERPNVTLNGLYSQAQAARALGVCRHTIKKYEMNGLLKFKIRKADSRSVITGKQLIHFWESCFF